MSFSNLMRILLLHVFWLSNMYVNIRLLESIIPQSTHDETAIWPAKLLESIIPQSTHDKIAIWPFSQNCKPWSI